MPSNDILLPRRALVGGLASLGGLALAGCSDENPPTYGNLLRIADDFTYRAQRLLLPRNALVRQFDHADITSMPAIGTTDPGNAKEPAFSTDFGEAYDRLRKAAFAEWRLEVAGLVARPGAYALADLKALPARTQITRHTCEEGWSSIAQWTGAPLAALLSHAGMLPTARYVNFHAYDETVDSIDLYDALHPQTILAYGMNGRDLPVAHGAPARLRVETQLGYKSVKFLRRIEVVEKFDDFGKKGNIQNGWSWYAGI
ncbi:molybdopterin-dependent oxidoreductase [Phenylobacterium sp.]|uniref:molybdopterin-dependent oxidoreductase n=1 Tax=Phenylobacterium sp. TaxID=1871053 RepID=UPI002C52E91B|nr:molybdopterin-dependent oxidoreductase [Phenylobacterium sp.]HLZ74395.1 molybdopterin-dependent oxidoreductase [Phenylobacterium sp.]